MRDDHGTPRRAFEASDLARVAVFAALIAALGLPGSFSVFGGVPITAQTFGVMLAGAILGPRLGALAILALLTLTAAGLPLLAGGRGGISVFVGPSAGYLIGWIAGAFVVGLIVHSVRPQADGLADGARDGRRRHPRDLRLRPPRPEPGHPAVASADGGGEPGVRPRRPGEGRAGDGHRLARSCARIPARSGGTGAWSREPESREVESREADDRTPPAP